MIKLIFKRVKLSTFIVNISKMLTGTIIGQALSVICVPIATRIYGAENYGDFAVFVSTATIILSFLGFGLQSAIMVAKDEEEAQVIYKIGVYGTGIILLLIFVALNILSFYVHLNSIVFNYKNSLVVLIISIYLTNMTNMSYAWLNRLGKYNILLFNPLISSLINNILLIVLGYMGYKKTGLYIGFLLSQLGTIIHMQKHMGKMNYKFNFLIIKSTLKKNKDFILFQYPAGIINGLANQLPIQVLSRLFGNTIVGYYSMTQRLLNIPISLIGGSITRVYFKEATDVQNLGNSACLFTFSLAKKIMILYSIPAVIIIAFGDKIIPFLLGENWQEAGQYLQIMMLWNMFYLLVNCFGGFPSIIGMQKRNMINAIVTLMSSFSVLMLIGRVTNNPLVTLLIFAIVNVVIHVWFYNGMFNKEGKLKNKYLKLASIFFVLIISCAILLRFFIKLF